MRNVRKKTDSLIISQRLQTAQSVVILTGVGVSKESGVPAYRAPQEGEWARVDPCQLATAEGYRANPQAGWQWSEAQRTLMSRVQPNPGHVAIADLETLLPKVTVLTQNIDCLHQKAGSREVIELHGSVYRHKCFANCQGNPTRLAIDRLPTPEDGSPPLCPHCGAWVRPDIVWFGETLLDAAFVRAIALVDHADVLLTVGTSGVVMPAACFPYRAK